MKKIYFIIFIVILLSIPSLFEKANVEMYKKYPHIDIQEITNQQSNEYYVLIYAYDEYNSSKFQKVISTDYKGEEIYIVSMNNLENQRKFSENQVIIKFPALIYVKDGRIKNIEYDLKGEK